MLLQQAELRRALEEAGAPRELAGRAAEEAAIIEIRVRRLEAEVRWMRIALGVAAAAAIVILLVLIG